MHARIRPVLAWETWGGGVCGRMVGVGEDRDGEEALEMETHLGSQRERL